jgi:hypothetical protein
VGVDPPLNRRKNIADSQRPHHRISEVTEVAELLFNSAYDA